MGKRRSRHMAVGQHKTTPTRLPGSPLPTIPRRAQTRPSPSSAEPGSAEPVKHASRCFPARADVTIGGKQTLVWDEAQASRAKAPALSLSPSQSDSPFRSTHATGPA
jgi:hypothetical protein